MAALRVVVLAALLPRASGGFYTACVPLRYGPDCSGECACAEHEDCDDGVTGTGECTCGFGSEALCGIPSRLVPPPPASNLACIDIIADKPAPDSSKKLD